MKERTKRLLTVGGSVLTALSIALSLLAFVTVTSFAATDTGMPAMSDIIPDENGTSAISLPEAGNVDSDVMTPDDSTRTPVVTSEAPATTTRPATTTARPSTTTSPDGTDTGMLEEEGGSILGAIIAVIVVVAIILVVIALIPRKKR
jgi:hypothetical protein